MLDVLALWDDDSPRSPAGHMAADEAIFRAARRPVLRIYRWTEPAVSFGYGQRIVLVEKLAPGLPLVRRWTGGGIVFHGSDLTLGLALPGERGPAGRIYRRIHEALLPMLRKTNDSARLACEADVVEGPACFEAPASADIVTSLGKICGGALRRTAEGTLYQGSIQAGTLPAAGDVAAALARVVVPFQPPQDFEAEVEALAAAHYRQWTARR